jgi:thioester reductase-like protein
MGETVLLTGFPGFLSARLIKKIAQHQPNVQMYLLCQPHLMDKGKKEILQIVEHLSLSASQFILLEGDISLNRLGLSEDMYDKLVNEVQVVWHLAAIYDLAVPKDIAYKVNVTGTENVNELVRKCKKIRRYNYFSTAYIAGTREGTIYESEVITPPSFRNYYERTKFEAECIVEPLKSELPVTIFRPSIVVGHSETGETAKFDGPYMVLNMLVALRRLPVLPQIGIKTTETNLVPYNYVIDAAYFLGTNSIGIGKTYHLTNPNPIAVSELYRQLMRELLRKRPYGKIPLFVGKWVLHIPAIRKHLRVEKEAIDYFVGNGLFDCTQAMTDLQSTTIRCPSVTEIIPALVAFYQKNYDNPQLHIHVS